VNPLRSRILPTPHAFSARVDGDFRSDVEAPARLARLLGADALRCVTQVHGAEVVHGRDAAMTVEADAVWTDRPAEAVGVRVADCVPILAARLDETGRAVAVVAIHAGWRGTAAGVVRAGLSALGAGRVVAAIGPAIGGCCYRVGPEVIDGVARRAPGEAWRQGDFVDLRTANAAILEACGVEVEVVGPCTRCDARWWSHRRDGAGAGRQVGAIRC
jgi:YfiH family protein